MGSQAAGGRSVRGQQLLPVREVQNSGEEAAYIVKTRCRAGPPRECDYLMTELDALIRNVIRHSTFFCAVLLQTIFSTPKKST